MICKKCNYNSDCDILGQESYAYNKEELKGLHKILFNNHICDKRKYKNQKSKGW